MVFRRRESRMPAAAALLHAAMSAALAGNDDLAPVINAAIPDFAANLRIRQPGFVEFDTARAGYQPGCHGATDCRNPCCTFDNRGELQWFHSSV